MTQSEEESFLKEITSHLPPNLSDDERDAYLQQLLASWRQHREHSREEEALMDKYLLTIKEHFRPQTPALYDFQQWPVNAELLERDALDSNLVQQIRSSGVYTFPLLPPSFCQSLIEEISYFEQWSVERGLKLYRPNSMNNYGVILDHFGFERCLDDVVRHLVEPLTRLLYPHVTLPLDSHHGFVVEYAMNKDKKLDFHVDDAAVTLNLCLGEEFTGGELYFGGVRCPQHVGRTKVAMEEKTVLQHQVGTACLHLGKHRHQALPITSGRRLNLILWCRSSQFQEPADDQCPSWCGMHQLVNV